MVLYYVVHSTHSILVSLFYHSLIAIECIEHARFAIEHTHDLPDTER